MNIKTTELSKHDKIMNLQEHILYLKRNMSGNKYSYVQRFKRIATASYLIAYINDNSNNLHRREYINSKFLSLLNDHLRFVKRSEKGKYYGSTSRFLEDRRINK